MFSGGGVLWGESWGDNCTHVIPYGRVEWGCYIACVYYCDPGYEKGIAHISLLQCSTDNEWRSGSTVWHQLKDLLCQPKRCQTTIPNGHLACAVAIPKVGTTCEYSCNEGYLKNVWTRNITCEVSTKWSKNPHQLCTNDQQCPYEIANGELDISCGRFPGSICEYKCYESYMSSDSSRTMITCGSDSNWDKHLSSLCKKIVCPLTIPNGEILSVCSHRDYNQKCYSYECSAGYEKPGHAVTLTCNKSSLWDLDRTRAESPCLNTKDLCPKTFQNGKIDRLCDRKHGSRCDFTCNEGCVKYLFFDRPNLLTCKNSSEWDVSPSGTCINCDRTTTTSSTPSCPASISNGQIDPVCNIHSGHECNFVCSNGCFPTADRLYCTSLGYWENEASACSCGTSFATPEKGSGLLDWLEEYKAALIGGAIGIVIVTVIACVVHRIIKCRKQRRDSGAAVSYHSVASNAPETGITPTAPSIFDIQPDEMRRSDAVTPSAPAYQSSESEPYQPPPSYREVVADPGKFNA